MQHKKLQNVYCNATRDFVTIHATMSNAEKSSEKLQKEFGFWIKSQRKAAGLTQGTVAANAPLDRVQLARIESGESGTKRDTVISIVEAINNKSSKHKIDAAEALDRFYGRWDENERNEAELTDDELVANGLFSGYYELDDEQKKLARRQIAAIIRSFKDEDFED